MFCCVTVTLHKLFSFVVCVCVSPPPTSRGICMKKREILCSLKTLFCTSLFICRRTKKWVDFFWRALYACCYYCCYSCRRRCCFCCNFLSPAENRNPDTGQSTCTWPIDVKWLQNITTNMHAHRLLSLTVMVTYVVRPVVSAQLTSAVDNSCYSIVDREGTVPLLDRLSVSQDSDDYFLLV